MKELSIEEKAKRYDEALNRAREVHRNEDDKVSTMEFIFPVLKESEDERIIKSFIRLLKAFYDVNFPTPEGFERKDMIAWLEKQGDKDKLIKELVEYKAKYTQEVLEKHINSISNEDDERLKKTTISFLKDFAAQGYENAVECIDWLENQGEQKPEEIVNLHDYLYGEQKPAWSEEDERMFKNTIALIETLEDYNKAPGGFGDVKFWLKDLKERYTWKPSE